MVRWYGGTEKNNHDKSDDRFLAMLAMLALRHWGVSGMVRQTLSVPSVVSRQSLGGGYGPWHDGMMA